MRRRSRLRDDAGISSPAEAVSRAALNDTDPVCGVCAGSVAQAHYTLREMYYGTRETFPYWECASCGCVQIGAVPEDLGRHYRNYYSHRRVRVRSNPVERWFRRGRLRRVLGHTRHPFWALVGRLADRPPKSWIVRSGMDVDARILDVGSGQGDRLQALHRQGFRFLEGVDPFVPADVRYPNGVIIHACELDALDGQFDVVMAHHSLEHMPDQHRAMAAMTSLLAPQGCVIVRIPLCSSYAWRTYRENWVQLDAPRHLFVHSEQSFRTLAAQHGLEVTDSFYDSTEFQFLGSERYLRDVALIEGTDAQLFSDDERRGYRRRAEQLNEARDGDQACFILRRRRPE